MASASTAGARPAGLLGAAAPGDRAIARLAAAALDRPHVEVCRWWVEPVAYRIGSPITAGLLRVRGVAAAGGRALPWSLFVKLLRSWRHWPGLQALPPALRERARADPSWRYEADVYRSDLAAALPDGLRLPRLHRVADLGDGRIALWLEDVATAPAAWDLPRFRRAARLLGRLGARLAGARLGLDVTRAPGEVTRMAFAGRVLGAALPELRAGATWAHPLLAAAPDRRLRADLLALAARAGGSPSTTCRPCTRRCSPPTPPAWPRRASGSTRQRSASASTPRWWCAAPSPPCRSSASASRRTRSWPAWSRSGCA